MAVDDRTLTIRAGLLVLGAALGVLGMATETDWLIYAAMGVIIAGLVLAILKRIKRE